MPSSFRPVNSHLPSPDAEHDEPRVKSPKTPRPSTAPQSLPPPQIMDDATTPTRATFGHNGMAQQRPLPQVAFPEAAKAPAADAAADHKSSPRENPHSSKRPRDETEMDLDESDNDEDGVESDGENSVTADDSRSKAKKKSQRFYCTDYPPCILSFTRSEHLARHIRKHTGERPFQCHCSRRFSRLDNLRQHAQTVHVNEDIPMDSLAATGTRFQRQIRTERVRPGAGRARASTAGSSTIVPPHRGHSKSLSTSNINNITSLGSNYSPRDDIRRRPPPLVMADPTARLSAESYRSVGSAQFPHRPASPSDYSTPTSATFSTGQNSPRWGPVGGSPASIYSRTHAMYPSGSQTPGRRLSVPSGGNPFQSPFGTGVLGRTGLGHASVIAPNSAGIPSSNGNYIGSPTMATAHAGWHRRESTVGSTDEAWRRRTWHPETAANFTSPGSRLSQVTTPSQLNPAPVQLPALGSALGMNSSEPQAVRLPGIESFDQKPLAFQKQPSPMAVDPNQVPRALLPSASLSEERRNSQWDTGIHRKLTRLVINNTTPPHQDASAWANETQRALQAHVEQPRPNQPTVRFQAGPQVVHPPSYQFPTGPPRGHQHTMSAPMVSGVRESRRHGWYNGPVTVHEDKVLEGRPHVERLAHPNLNHFAGFPARDQAPVYQQPSHTTRNSGGLDALVDAALNQQPSATAC